MNEKFLILMPFFIGLSLLTKAQDTSNSISDCNPTVSIHNDVLEVVKQHIQRVGKEEVPILVVDRQGDSTFCYISSFNSANTIAKNPPTGVYIVKGKDVLVYDKKQHSFFLNEKCLTNLVKKYRSTLYVDKLNREKGLPDGTVQYVAYDPIWIKVSLYANKVVNVTENGIQHVPIIDYSF